MLESQTPSPDARPDIDVVQQPLPPHCAPAWAPPGPLLVLRQHLKVVQSGFGSLDDWRHTLESFCFGVLAIGLRRSPVHVIQTEPGALTPVVELRPEPYMRLWESVPERGSPLRPPVGSVFESPRLHARVRGQL